jgi:hypothetical protein
MPKTPQKDQKPIYIYKSSYKIVGYWFESLLPAKRSDTCGY